MDPSFATEVRSPAGIKQAFHFGAPGRELFAWFHPAATPTRDACVVLCNALGTDLTRSDRAYRHLAERLAADGFAVLRFEMLGTGDSAGDEHAPDLVRAWLDDIGHACDELRARSGAKKTALVGLRLGATLAMTLAAERGDVDSLVLWSPCISGKAFVTEQVKLHKLYERIEPQLAAAPKAGGDGEEALGIFLPRAVIRDLEAIDLLAIDKRPARRTLVVDPGNLAGRDALMQNLERLAAGPELKTHPGQKFLITISHRGLLPDDVLESIRGFLRDGHPYSEPSAPERRASVPAPSREVPIAFGRKRPLFAILTPAEPEHARRGRPAIVLANTGCVNRVGPHRMYVAMARRWAKLGFDVLRVDLSGIGDSPVEPGEKENVTYPRGGYDDLDEAMHALRERVGADRFVLAGVCSGGDYAFQLGARASNIASAIVMNPRTFLMLDLQAVESRSDNPAAPDAIEVPRTLGRMAEAGVDTLLVVSENDPGVAYADRHFTDEMRALERVVGFTRKTISGADHTFTPVLAQRRVVDLVTAHLSALYL